MTPATASTRALRALARPATGPLAFRTGAALPPHLGTGRTITASALARKDPGEGVKGKESVGGDNPISARVHGAAKAAKSVVDGAIGVGQAATGEQSKLGTDPKHPGPDTRDQIQEAQDKGRKEGLAHKGEQQGAI